MRHEWGTKRPDFREGSVNKVDCRYGSDTDGIPKKTIFRSIYFSRNKYRQKWVQNTIQDPPQTPPRPPQMGNLRGMPEIPMRYRKRFKMGLSRYWWDVDEIATRYFWSSHQACWWKSIETSFKIIFMPTARDQHRFSCPGGFSVCYFCRCEQIGSFQGKVTSSSHQACWGKLFGTWSKISFKPTARDQRRFSCPGGFSACLFL